jgi:anti-anti-sigma factor
MERTVQGSEGERVLAARGGLRVLGSRRRRGELRLVGELDVASREVLTAVAWARDYDVLDASELSFVDCAGLAALLAFASAAQQHGHRLKISSPGRALVRLATLTGTAEQLGLGPGCSNPLDDGDAGPPTGRRRAGGVLG